MFDMKYMLFWKNRPKDWSLNHLLHLPSRRKLLAQLAFFLSYLSFCSVGPGIYLVWGNVDPIFAITFGRLITHLNIFFVIFLHIFCHVAHYSTLGMNEFKVYVKSVYYYHFAILLIKIDIVWNTFDIWIYVYICL